MESGGSSLIDYVLVSQNLLKQFVTFYVDDPNILADHCAVNFSLHFRSTADTASFDADDDYETVESKYIWDQTVSNKYRTTLNLLQTVQKFDSIVNGITNDSSDSELDCCIQIFEKPYKKQPVLVLMDRVYVVKSVKFRKLTFFKNLMHIDMINLLKIVLRW